MAVLHAVLAPRARLAALGRGASLPAALRHARQLDGSDARPLAPAGGSAVTTFTSVSWPPVVLVHGWGGSFADDLAATAASPPLLEDAGRKVIGVDLLGHGEAPEAARPGGVRRPHDAHRRRPARRAGRRRRVLARARSRCCGWPAAGRSGSGASCSPASASNVFEPDDRARRGRSSPRVEGDRRPDDERRSQAVRASTPPSRATTRLALAARACGRPADGPFTDERLAAVTCPVLVVIGDNDFAGPADELAAALPDARLIVLRNVDHFATPESFGFIDAALGFLDAVRRDA